jgi:hypothetical protein
VKIREIAIMLAVCGTLLLAAHWISEGQRHEVVAAGAGSGGSQDSKGSTDVRGYLVDRNTGKTWLLFGDSRVTELPAVRIPCDQMGENLVETESGCQALQKP